MLLAPSNLDFTQRAEKTEIKIRRLHRLRRFGFEVGHAPELKKPRLQPGRSGRVFLAGLP